MFCRNCGFQVEDGAVFCPKCGTQIATPQNAPQPNPTQPFTNAPGGYQPNPYGTPQPATAQGSPFNSAEMRTYLVMGIVAIAAIIYAVLAIICLVRIFDSVEAAINAFSSFSGVLSAVGTIGFVAVGILLAGAAVIAATPLIRGLLDRSALNQGAIDRSLVAGIVFLVICIAVWVCKLIFHSASGGDVSFVLNFIFSAFGSTATDCIVPTIIALVILYVLRMKLLAPRAY